MPTRIYFRSGDAKHIMRLTNRDLLISSHVALHPFYQAAFRSPGTLPANELLSMVDDFITLLQSEWDLLSNNYSFKFSKDPLPGFDRFQSGGRGLMFEGQPALIHAGPSECYISTIIVREDGTGAPDRMIDVRGRETIEIGDGVTIMIRRKSARLTWLDELEALKPLLSSLGAENVSYRVEWSTPSVLECVKAIHADSPGADGNGETLVEMGDNAVPKLLKMLSDKKHAQYVGTVAMLLTSFFADDRVRQAIETKAASERDEAMKKYLLSLLADSSPP